MLLFNSREVSSTNMFQEQGRYPGFRCVICPKPIRYIHRWHHDLLIQAALDPMVEAMDPVEDALCGGKIFSFNIRYASDRMRVVALHDHLRPPSLDAGLPVVFVSRASVLAEPVAGIARAVWATRRRFVSAADRVRILNAFETRTTIPLGDLASLVGGDDGVDLVLSLACAGQLSLQLSKELGPATQVRRRPIRDEVGECTA